MHTYILLSFTLCSSIATAAVLQTAKTPSTIEQRDAQNFRGIWWGEALQSCTPAEYAKIQEATRMADQMVNKFVQTEDWSWTAAFNRLFHSDGWSADKSTQDVWAHIFQNMQTVAQWPKRGPTRSYTGDQQRAKSVAYRCNGLSYDTPIVKCHKSPDPDGKWSGPHAQTISNHDNEPVQGVHPGKVIVFCPAFFQDSNLKYLNDITASPKQESEIALLRSYEWVIAHEWMHVAGMGFSPGSLVDLKGRVPSIGPTPVSIYGDAWCHEYAWQFDRSAGHKVALDIYVNADSYAWTFAYHWFHETFGWKSDGSTNFNKRKRAAPAPDDNLNDGDSTLVQTEDQVKPPTDIPANCKPGAGDPTANDGHNSWFKDFKYT